MQKLKCACFERDVLPGRMQLSARIVCTYWLHVLLLVCSRAASNRPSGVVRPRDGPREPGTGCNLAGNEGASGKVGKGRDPQNLRLYVNFEALPFSGRAVLPFAINLPTPHLPPPTTSLLQAAAACSLHPIIGVSDASRLRPCPAGLYGAVYSDPSILGSLQGCQSHRSRLVKST